MTDQEQELSPLEKLIEAQEQSDWAAVLATDEGRRVVWTILSHCGLFRNPYTGNAHTNYQCGQQAVAQWILDQWITPIDPHILGRMMVEHEALLKQLEAEQNVEEQDNVHE